MRTEAAVRMQVETACAGAAAAGKPVRCEEIGESEEGRPLLGVMLGNGPTRVSLLSGAHADEPVGTLTLQALIEALCGRDAEAEARLQQYTFCIVPHVNPDGAAINAPWIERWPDAEVCLRHVVREPPGRDIEFGYPAMRAENRAVSEFLKSHGPFGLHMSLHGMLVSEGGMLLVERTWAPRTAALRETYAQEMRSAGLRLFDYDRQGEKGFEYLGPGFASTPRGAAMREHFESIDDPATAKLFHDSSMEFVRGLGGDPLCLVTELPLWIITNLTEPPEPRRPTTYLKFREQSSKWRMRLERGEDTRDEVRRFGLKPLDVATAVRLQTRALELGLETVTGQSFSKG